MAAMLPWRRSKFVLVEENEGKGKSKSLGPGLSYASLLSNFVRSCPDLWPECPLERLGSVFRSKRQKVELNKEDPTYTAWYLGNAVTLQAKGEGCTEEAVEKIWAKSEFGSRSTKMKLTLGPHGIRMNPCEKGPRRPSHAYLLHRITYCVADGRHPKVFAWVYRHQVKNKAVVLRCHAVLLSKAEKAHAMALLLYQTAHSAFNEFKRLKRQNDSRHIQQQLLGEAIIPLVPLRKLLNCKCPYRPPADRGRSAPRLSAIQEEEEEEEEEKKAGRQAGGLGTSCDCATSSANGRAGTNLSSCAGAATGSIDVQLSIRTTLAVGSSPGPAPGYNTDTTRGRKLVKSRERPEVLTLAHELRVCTLRGVLQREDLPSWEPPQESSCLPC